MDNLYLVHYGVKGQKWGVRRYQNPDGTLTKRGQKRYDKQETKRIRNERREMAKRLYAYSDKDILAVKNRMDLESNYQKSLDVRYTTVKGVGRQTVDNLLTGGKLAGVATSAITGGAAYKGKKIVTNFINDEAAAYMFPNPNKKK